MIACWTYLDAARRITRNRPHPVRFRDSEKSKVFWQPPNRQTLHDKISLLKRGFFRVSATLNRSPIGTRTVSSEAGRRVGAEKMGAGGPGPPKNFPGAREGQKMAIFARGRPELFYEVDILKFDTTIRKVFQFCAIKVRAKKNVRALAKKFWPFFRRHPPKNDRVRLPAGPFRTPRNRLWTSILAIFDIAAALRGPRRTPEVHPERGVAYILGAFRWGVENEKFDTGSIRRSAAWARAARLVERRWGRNPIGVWVSNLVRGRRGRVAPGAQNWKLMAKIVANLSGSR
jgi:hypothetical protein